MTTYTTLRSRRKTGQSFKHHAFSRNNIFLGILNNVCVCVSVSQKTQEERVELLRWFWCIDAAYVSIYDKL